MAEARGLKIKAVSLNITKKRLNPKAFGIPVSDFLRQIKISDDGDQTVVLVIPTEPDVDRAKRGSLGQLTKSRLKVAGAWSARASAY